MFEIGGAGFGGEVHFLDVEQDQIIKAFIDFPEAGQLLSVMLLSGKFCVGRNEDFCGEINPVRTDNRKAKRDKIF